MAVVSRIGFSYNERIIRPVAYRLLWPDPSFAEQAMQVRVYGRLRGSQLHFCLACFVVSALLTCCPHAGAEECTFEWRPGEGLSGIDGTVNTAATWDPDGQGLQPEVLVVGGNFTVVGESLVNRVAIYEGASWQPLGSGMSSSASFLVSVNAITTYSGELIAGGQFTSAGGISANNIARWDGSAWQPLGTGMSGDDPFATVYALMVYNDELVAGGYFSTAGDGNANYIARWDGSAWHPLGTGMNSDVRSLAVYNGELIAGGYFSTTDGVPANRIARWNGSSWQSLGTGTNGSVRALTIHNGALIAGGGFTTAGSVSANRIARWDGISWDPLGAGVSGFGSGNVFTLAVSEGELIAGGDFTTAGGMAANRIARWDGLTWSTLGAGITSTGNPNGIASVNCLTSYGGALITGGSFTAAGIVGASNIARWHEQSWEGLGAGAKHTVLALAVYDSDLIAGGQFTTAHGGQFNYVARWNGLSWEPIGTGMNTHPPYSGVFALAVHYGDLVAGGWFTQAGGAAADHIARWDGASWHPLGTGLNGAPVALTIYDGELIAGGFFSTAGAISVQGIAGWDGSAWHAFDTGVGTALSMTVYNGELIASGISGWTARWDGASWQPLKRGLSGPVRALTVYDGELIAGGAFTAAGNNSAGDTPASYIARWDGLIWRSVGFGMNGEVRTLIVYNGELIAGGYFTAGYPGGEVNHIARWDGSSWSALGSIGNGTNGLVATSIIRDGEIIVGGDFTTADGVLSAYWARWGPSGNPPVITESPADQGVFPGESVEFAVIATGSEALNYQWGMNGVNLADGPSAGGGVISGSTMSLLRIDEVGVPDVGQYDCAVTGTCTIISQPAALSVGIPSALITGGVSRKYCDLPISTNGMTSEPRFGGLAELHVIFDRILYPATNPVIVEQAVCPSPPEYIPYSASTINTVVDSNKLVLTFAPYLPNARTYRVHVPTGITSVPNQFIEFRVLKGDVNSDGFVNGSDRSAVVGAWTGPGFTCVTDLNNSGATNATDRSIVINGWTGPGNCAP